MPNKMCRLYENKGKSVIKLTKGELLLADSSFLLQTLKAKYPNRQNDSLSWLGIGGASSLILAPGTERWTILVSECVEVQADHACVRGVLRRNANTLHKLVSNPKHPMLTLCLR